MFLKADPSRRGRERCRHCIPLPIAPSADLPLDVATGARELSPIAGRTRRNIRNSIRKWRSRRSICAATNPPKIY
jgi:hypothetical protein